MNVFGYDCFYYDSNIGLALANTLVSFCIRPETSFELNDERKSCHGDIITFEELKLAHVSEVDLFQWNAVIEIIDLYEKYLLLPNLIHDHLYHCNCSSPLQFGKYCEYEFYDIDSWFDEKSFSGLVHRSNKDGRPRKEMNEKYLTCYTGIHCKNNLNCLDWRQICNGIVDCDDGEDEPFELCLEMELNECNNQTEYRCQNGMCIPFEFLSDSYTYCLDGSDSLLGGKSFSITNTSRLCSSLSIFECDELKYGWKQFSCGDGHFIFYSDLTLRTTDPNKKCQNKRDIMYLKQLFSSTNQDQCWKAMICLSGFDYLYSHINCLTESIETNINKYCSNEYYFPSNPVVYSYVYFLYDKLTHHQNWFNYSGPNYICYKKEYCPNNVLISSAIVKNNLICFDVNETLFSWKNFHEYVIYLFSSCYTRFQPSVHRQNKMLYECKLSNTFISKYRVKDKTKDCFLNEDEDRSTDLCSLNTNNHFKCLTSVNECVHEFCIRDGEFDCSDGSDEVIGQEEFNCHTKYCIYHLGVRRTLLQIYRFRELCDNIVNPYLSSNLTNETDETDCQYWPYICNSYYTRCNQVWNCKNGRDEIGCRRPLFDINIRNSFNCTKDEHYCIQLIDNDVKISCIHMNRSGDGTIDCIGGTDERLTNICVQKYPFDYKRRFYCMNSSICIRPDEVCNRIIDCPFEDDERVCPWLYQSNSSTFYCKNAPLHSFQRCDDLRIYDRNCALKEQLWFCDLGLENKRTLDAPKTPYKAYPPINQNLNSISSENINSNKLLSLIVDEDIMWLCNQGFPIQSTALDNKLYCFCSPSFYGDYCQYQAERLFITMQIQTLDQFNSLSLFRLMIYLLSENQTVISYDELLYNHQTFDKIQTFYLHLPDQRMKNQSLFHRTKAKLIHVDLYIINQKNVQYVASWLYQISYSFLPANRLLISLSFDNELFITKKCKKQCGLYGKCMQYRNVHNIEYCRCDQGWFGKECESKSSSNLCNQTSCASNSQCIILNDVQQQIQCICPLGRSGPQCYIKHNSCANVICQNNGTCLPLDQRNGAIAYTYTCICQDDYDGIYCQSRKIFSNISIPGNITVFSRIPAIIVIFGHLFETAVLQLSRELYDDITLPTTFQTSSRNMVGFIRMFHNKSTSFYYLIAFHPEGVTFNINTSVISSNLCPNISELFNETIMNDYSYLKRLKLYHLPCQQNPSLRCFFDDYRMCLCNSLHNSDCFLFQHDSSICSYCKNDGLCLSKDASNQPRGYVCLCSECSFGSHCQFSSGNYFITFDILLGPEIKSDISFSQQPFIIYFTLITLIVILVLSFICNTMSLMIFSNKKLRQVGCDLYLLVLTIISKIGILLLLFRFLYMIIVQIYKIEDVVFIEVSCKILEYLLRLIPSIFDWLTVCISIERVYTVLKDIQFTKHLALKTLKLSRWIVLIVLLLNVLSTLHRPFYLTLVDEPTLYSSTKGHPWCVLDFESSSWNVYEKVINIFHLAMPIVLNLLSIIFFITRKVQTELRTTIRKNEATRYGVVKEQLSKYKPLIISIAIIIILEIPRFVLTFVLACIRHDWQRYVYLIGYLISFLPLIGILFIYIKPSPKYKKRYESIMEKKLCMVVFRRK